MSKKSPNVVFKSKYSLALTCRDNKNKSLNYKEERLKDVDDMIDYYSDEKKKTVGMFEYYMGHTRKEKYNLVMEDGSYATKQDIAKIKTNYKKYIENSNLWKGILSFKREYLDENIDIKQVQDEIKNIKATEKANKEALDDFLKQTGLRKDNSRLVI